MPRPPEGLPCYGFESLLDLAGLATVTMLRRHRRQPADGQQPVACYWTGHDWALLYQAADAVGMAPLSAGRQRLYDLACTCAECGAKALDPFERGDDGQRYCQSCQGPVHQRLWEQARAADRLVVAAWAREVLGDATVVLGGCRGRDYYREVYAADLAGTVLLDVKLRYSTDLRVDPDWLASQRFAGTVSPGDLVDQVAALAARRPVTWWPSVDLRDLAVEFDDQGRGIGGVLATADGDRFGDRYARWVGDLHGASYRYQPTVAHQPPPWDPREQVDRMRELLAEMACGATGAG
jgi:hypothetical protein